MWAGRLQRNHHVSVYAMVTDVGYSDKRRARDAVAAVAARIT